VEVFYHRAHAAIFRALPLVIFSLTGGVLTDRLDRRRLFITTQSIAMSFALLLGILTTTGWIRVWHIYAVSFLAGSINTFDRPLVTAMIPSLVRREHLSTAYAMNITLRQTAFLKGMARRSCRFLAESRSPFLASHGRITSML
jgi:MFS family permease